MARRFGRNQRRQLKAQVERLGHDLHVTGTQYHKQVEEVAALRHAFAQLMAELPEGSALKLELDQLTMDGPYMNGIQWTPRPGGVTPVMRFDGPMANQTICTALQMMAYRINCDPDLVSQRLCFELETADGKAAYLVDRHFFKARGFSPRMVEKMGQSIAKELAYYYGKHHGGR